MKKIAPIWAYFALTLILIPGCVSFPDSLEGSIAPSLEATAIKSIDGRSLSYATWQADDPVAIIIAVHGMNDYSNTFSLAGAWWAKEKNITTYAYDQRGFGQSETPGIWPGSGVLQEDLRAAIAAITREHPEQPIYVIGHSMGASVVLAAMANDPLDVDGVVLAAPGVWGGSQLPIPYRLAVNWAAAVSPGKTLTGERAVRQATDNIPILRQMQADPLVIKGTRIDSVLGVTRIMGEAYDATDEVGGNILFLYGEKDEVIPIKSMKRAANRLCGTVDRRSYQNGWHLLFRDLDAELVWEDVATWIEGKKSADPKNIGGGPAEVSCTGDKPPQI